jgi:hypothetical protein
MAVNLSLFAGAGWQFFSDNGIPLSGGLLYTYAAGTTTPATTYTSNTGLTANSNPIVLNSAGRVPYEIWLTEGSSYKFILKTSTNVTIGTYDNIAGGNDATALNTFIADLANTSSATKGDFLVGFKQSTASGVFANAVGKTVHQKLQDLISVKDFGAVGDGTTNDTTAIQNAVNAVSSSPAGGTLYFPQGTYLTSKITIGPNITLDGGGCIVKAVAGQNYIFSITGTANITIRDFVFDATGMSDVGGTGGLPQSVLYIDVAVGPCSNILVDNCRFTNIPLTNQNYHAIGFNGAECVVQNCYVDQSGGDALNFNGGFNVIVNNVVKNGGDGGIAVNNGGRANISNNYIFKCDLGIGCGPEGNSTDVDTYSLVIANNTINSCGWGINLGWFSNAGRRGPSPVSITGNSIYSCKSYGIRYDGDSSTFVLNATVSGNTIMFTGSNAYDGSFGANSGDIVFAACRNVSIVGNSIKYPLGTGNTRSIWLNQCVFVTITGNTIYGYDPALTPGYTYGLLLTDASYTVASSNTIGGARTSVYIDGAGSQQNDLAILNNRLQDFTVNGVNLLNASFGTDINNNILGTGTASLTGILLSSNINRVTCKDNVFKMPSGSAIVITTSTVSDFYDVSYNTTYGLTVTDGGPAGATKRVTANF